jgi:hypothetical protein
VKLYRNAIILLIVAALLAGVYVIVKDKKSDSEPAADKNTIKIFDLDTDKMVEMTIDNGQDKLVFAKKTVKEDDNEKKIWEILSPKDLKIDESKVSSIATNISSLVAEKIIEEEAGDISIYGLDKPVLISVKMDDGTLKTLEIGNETPTKSGYYVKVKDEKKVYTIGSYIGKNLKVGKNDVKARDLFSIKPEEITEFSLERGESLVFKAKKSGDFDWIMTSPIQGNVNISAISPMLEAVSQTSAVNFIEENPSNLEQYGLLNPSYCLEFHTPAGREKLLLGKEKERGVEIYAKLADSSEVFSISLGTFNFLDKPLKEIIEVFTIDPSRVGALVETAHSILTGLEPTHEISFALTFNKLFGVHINDQDGIKNVQDKSFGVENLRSAFNQVKVLTENNYSGYIGLAVRAMRTQKIDDCYRHLENTLKIFKMLQDKVAKFDYNYLYSVK